MTDNNTAHSDNGSNSNVITINNTSSTPDPVIPLQFPPRADYFTGRTEQLNKLINDLQPRKVVTLCGAGGMGKTALAAEAVYTLLGKENKPPKDFPNGVVFHSFYDSSTAESALRTIAKAFKITSEGTAEELAKEALNAKTVLIILDGAEDADDFDSVLKVLSTVGCCGVLITTRDKRQGGENQQKMQPLFIEDAVALLGKWAADYIDNQAVATEICERVGGLPLAVRLVGRYLKETEDSASSYLEWLEENLLEALDPDDSAHRHKSVKVLLARSVAQLTDTGRQVLPIFGCLAMKPVPLSILAAVLEFSQGKSRKAIKSLINFGLIQGNNDHYEVTHALIHTYAREQTPLSEQLLARLADWYRGFAAKKSKKGLQGYYILDTQQAHLLNLIEQVYQQKMWIGVIGLVGTIDHYLAIRGYWEEEKRLLPLAITATQAVKFHNDEAIFLAQLGSVYFKLGDINVAIGFYEKSLSISKAINHRQMESAHLGNLGIAYHQLGNFDKAIDYHQKALIISREMDYQQGIANHLGNLGTVYGELGELKKAAKYFEEALDIKIEGNEQKRGSIVSNLGNTYFHLGELDKAIFHFQQGLDISRKIGDRQGEGHRLNNLGATYVKQGELEVAHNYYQQALVIFEAICSPKAEETRDNLKRLEQL